MEKNVAEEFHALKDHGDGTFLAPHSAVDGPRQTAEESYSWCAQGSLLHCYYMTREQCEQTVDYHGFCVPNPDVSPRKQ